MLDSELTVSAEAVVPADRVWALLSSPVCWPAWAPHMRHVRGRDTAGAPGAVHTGQRLQIDTVAPFLRVPVTVTDVDESHSWTMRADLPLGHMISAHCITTDGNQTTVTVSMRWEGPALLAPVLLWPYKPVATLSIRRLLRLAAAEARGILDHPSSPVPPMTT